LGRVLEDHRELEGLYHVASEPISKYDLLSKIKDAAGLDLTIEPSDEPRLDRSLDGSRFLRATGIAVPSWDAMISALAKDDTPYDTWRKRHGTA
jgi:dTDP-4-dehydrorhamnose reductase